MRISQDSQKELSNCNKNCWHKLQIGIKFICVITVLSAILTIFKQQLSIYLANDIIKTMQQMQIWRLMTSFLSPVVSPTISAALMMMPKLFISIYIFIKITQNIERQYSTAYLIINCFIQTLVFNIALIAIYYPFIALNLKSQQPIAYGIFPLIMNFLWQSVGEDQNIILKIMFVSYMPKYQYIAFALCSLQVLVELINGGMVGSYIICMLLAYYQHIIRRRLFLTLPLVVYQKFDSIIPTKITNFKAYTKVSDVIHELQPRCAKGFFDQNLPKFHLNQNPNPTSPNQQKKLTFSNKFKKHWTNKYQNRENIQQINQTNQNNQKQNKIKQIIQVGQTIKQSSFPPNNQPQQTFQLKESISINNDNPILISSQKSKQDIIIMSSQINYDQNKYENKKYEKQDGGDGFNDDDFT